MRSIFLFFLVGFYVTAGLQAAPATLQAEKPEAFVNRFYTAYETWDIRGVPFPDQYKLISPYLSKEIMDLFREVQSQRDVWEKQNPYDPKNPLKAPWNPEGDVFCSLYEGITSFTVGKSKVVGQRVKVESHLVYVAAGKSYPWTDYIFLKKMGESWVVSDIQYGDREKETLTLRIRSVLEETSRDLRR